MIKTAITGPEFDKAQPFFEAALADGFICLRAPSEEKALAGFIIKNEVWHVVVGVESYRKELYHALSPGSVIARFGVGFDGLNLKLASEQGLLCTNTPDALTDCVAEHAMGLILAAARGIAGMDGELRRGQWRPRIGSELGGKTLAVIGAGKIGGRLMEIASAGFRMRAVGMGRSGDFEETVREADFVSLHLPLNASTRNYLNQERLRLLPGKTWIINTARGGLVDEKALFTALTQGKITGACLDFFEREPYSPVSPDCDFRTLDNVILSPHAGSATREACGRMAFLCLRNIQCAETGRIPEMNLLNARKEPAHEPLEAKIA